MHFKWSSGKWRPFCPGLNVLKVIKDAFTVWIISWGWFDKSRVNSLCWNITYCLFYRIHNMPADALRTSGVRASTVMKLTHKSEYFVVFSIRRVHTWGLPFCTKQITFSSMKIDVFWFKFDWSLFPRVQLTYVTMDSDNVLAPNGQQAITWTQQCWLTMMCEAMSHH